MSLATHTRGVTPHRGIRSITPAKIQIAVAVLGVAGVIALIAHGHDAATLVGGATVHTTTETGLMTAAMMLPISALAIPKVMQRSLRQRRLAASVEHVVGFGFVWFVFGVAAALAAGSVAGTDTAVALFGGVALAAAAWQMADRRRIITGRCGRLRSAAPRGVRASFMVMLAGADQARWCLRTCALSMGAMILAPSPAVMGALWVANLSEWAPGPNPFAPARYLRPAAVLAVTGLGALIVAATS